MTQTNLPPFKEMLPPEVYAHMQAIWEEISESQFPSMQISMLANAEKAAALHKVWPKLGTEIPFVRLPEWEEINNLEVVQIVGYMFDLSDQLLMAAINEIDFSVSEISYTELLKWRRMLLKKLSLLTSYPKFQMLEHRAKMEMFAKMDDETRSKYSPFAYAEH